MSDQEAEELQLHDDEVFLSNLLYQRHSARCLQRRQSKDAGNRISLEMGRQGMEKIIKELIVKSFEACAITTPTDGSRDNKITCF
uniref:Uncharacterized protein n=1 Tax=Ditylenchus dipsaci TaxID=166011 RepID=A0A915DLY1_9BILA